MYRDRPAQGSASTEGPVRRPRPILLPCAKPGQGAPRRAAVSAFGETLRCEVAHFGIRVVEIMPGPIDTDMLARSDRVPEASDRLGYEEMAAAAYEGRKAVEPMTTPAPEAAARIRAVILADAAPLKHGCDDLATGLLDAWSADPIALVGTEYAGQGVADPDPGA